MNTDPPCQPGYTIGALALASGTSFLDAALGVATVLGGIAAPVSVTGGLSQSRAAENPIATVDNIPAPRVDEV